MNTTLTNKIQFFLQLEVYFALTVFLVLGFLFYKVFLKKISSKRHANLKKRFLSTASYILISGIGALVSWLLTEYISAGLLQTVIFYTAAISLILGSIAVVKSAQILAYLFLFFQNMSQGIPRLIVNLLTVVASFVVITYLASEVLAIHLTTMLATSAVFSLVLGLALQDTLGNLFSGVAMQIGQPFKIGDWVEINTESKKWLGQIQEITWRATFLSTFADEWLMIPNKTIAQSQIIIMSNANKPVRHSLVFRFGFNEDIQKIKKSINQAFSAVEGVMSEPPLRVLVTETTESWITIKVFYSIHDYSLKYRIADDLFVSCLQVFQKQGVKLETNQIKVSTDSLVQP